MTLKDIKELWYENERALIEFKNLRVQALENDDMQLIIEASKARDKWRRTRSAYNRACIQHVTELIHD